MCILYICIYIYIYITYIGYLTFVTSRRTDINCILIHNL